MTRVTQVEGLDEVIKEAVEQRVKVGISAALTGDDPQVLVDRIVDAILKMEVKDTRTYRKVPLIEKLAIDTVKDAAQIAMQNWIKEQAPLIQEAINKQLSTAKVRNGIAKSLIDSLVRHADTSYGIKVTIMEQPHDE